MMKKYRRSDHLLCLVTTPLKNPKANQQTRVKASLMNLFCEFCNSAFFAIIGIAQAAAGKDIWKPVIIITESQNQSG